MIQTLWYNVYFCNEILTSSLIPVLSSLIKHEYGRVKDTINNMMEMKEIIVGIYFYEF
jgi:hypothetical protein